MRVSGSQSYLSSTPRIRIGNQSGGGLLGLPHGYLNPRRVLLWPPPLRDPIFLCGWTEVALSSETVIAISSRKLPFGSYLFVARLSSHGAGTSLLTVLSVYLGCTYLNDCIFVCINHFYKVELLFVLGSFIEYTIEKWLSRLFRKFVRFFSQYVYPVVTTLKKSLFVLPPIARREGKIWGFLRMFFK